MTVLLEQQQTQAQQIAYKNEIDNKVFKVLVAFSQSIEKSLINSQDTLHAAENSLNINITTHPQAIDSSQFDSSNLGLYTVNLVRNVIKRSNDLSDEFKSLLNTLQLQQQQKDKQYKDEIQFLKSKIEQLTNNNNNNGNNNIVVKHQSPDKLESITLDDENSNSNLPIDSNNKPIINNQVQSLIQQQQQQSSPVGSSLSISSSKDISSLDWDTKYQTELQLNAMLSEFLKDDFEISNLGVSDEVSSTSPSISNSSTQHTGLGSSGSFSPSNNTSNTNNNNNLNSNNSPSLNHSNSSASSMSNDNNKLNNSTTSASSTPTKKTNLTDLLDQIDLDSGNSNTPSKQKKGKFKFF